MHASLRRLPLTPIIIILARFKLLNDISDPYGYVSSHQEQFHTACIMTRIKTAWRELIARAGDFRTWLVGRNVAIHLTKMTFILPASGIRKKMHAHRKCFEQKNNTDTCMCERWNLKKAPLLNAYGLTPQNIALSVCDMFVFKKEKVHCLSKASSVCLAYFFTPLPQRKRVCRAKE